MAEAFNGTLTMLDAVLLGVLDLQPKWTKGNTLEMQERGSLIRHQGPRLVSRLLGERLGEPPFDLGVEGRDETGLKTRIPWIRVYSKAISPSATVRKIIWMMSVSVDGYMEGPNREIDWHMVDDELFRHLNGWLAGAGGFLEGRVTYELMAEFWPTADQDPAATPTVVEFAQIWRDMPKVVYSRTLERADWNATVVHDVVPADVLALKAQPGGDLVLGGADLAAEFARHDLIDEYRLYVHPIVIGRGTPMLRPSDAKVPLQLIETHTFGNGVVMLRYERRPSRPAGG